MSLPQEESPGPFDGGAPLAGTLPPVEIFTDGACLGNPGPGGYGLILSAGGKRKELSGGFRLTTNNRMELLGAIKGLEALRFPCRVTVYSDSQYVVNGFMKGWARRWREKGWMKDAKTPALNPDLWARLLDLAEKHRLEMRWVRGHSGHAENERCDALAVLAAKGPDLKTDAEFERMRGRKAE